MTDDRLFSLIALVCVLLWVAGGSGLLPGYGRQLRRAAFVILAIGLAVAVFKSVQALLA